jgi:beta-glucosidase
MMPISFPTGFLWGVAGAGHQIEGDNVTSDTWFAENVTPSVFKEKSGKACNSWEMWRQDLGLVQGMGLNAYRFSVEWARIEPVEGQVDNAALQRYREMAADCRRRGLAPIVTFNHFTAPHWFAAKGGWLHPDAPAAFARHCDRVMEAMGDLIAYAVTLNEPNLPHLLVWIGLPKFVQDLERATLEAASRAAGVDRYRLANVVVPEEMQAIEDGLAAGHLAGRAAIKARRPDLPVGLSMAIVDDQVFGPDARLRDRKRAEVYGRWLDLAKGDDFLGVQNYERLYYDANGQVGADGGPAPHGLYLNTDPRSLAECVRYAHGVCGRPILVTEHGMGTEDDSRRADFIEKSLPDLALAAQDLPVLGYCHWSLMDNFEWIFGYGPKLGLHAVDRVTFERKAKPSAAVLSARARANAAI